MDFGTLSGLLIAIGAIAVALLRGGDMFMYIDSASIFIVVVGSFAVVMMSYPLKQFFSALHNIRQAFFTRITPPEDLIDELVAIADITRKGGFLALEDINTDHTFVRKAADLVVDGYDPEVIKQSLSKDIKLSTERHSRSIEVIKQFAETAPAMGMVGTLIGLVGMLINMDDPKSIAPAMATALLTTLYGALIANVVAQPLAKKMEIRTHELLLNQHMIKDAFVGIVEGLNPRALRETLENYLAEELRTEQASSAQNGAVA